MAVTDLLSLFVRGLAPTLAYSSSALQVAYFLVDPLDKGDCFAVLAGILPPAEECGPYPEWSTSEYVLPYRPGTALVVSQGNCALGSHRGAARHVCGTEPVTFRKTQANPNGLRVGTAYRAGD